MKEFDENEAIKAMAAAVSEELRSEDALLEVLDLIYDYYDENGDLEIDISDDDDEDSAPDIKAMVSFISRHVRKNSAAKDFTRADIEAAVRAEINYELSLQ